MAHGCLQHFDFGRPCWIEQAARMRSLWTVNKIFVFIFPLICILLICRHLFDDLRFLGLELDSWIDSMCVTRFDTPWSSYTEGFGIVCAPRIVCRPCWIDCDFTRKMARCLFATLFLVGHFGSSRQLTIKPSWTWLKSLRSEWDQGSIVVPEIRSIY